MSLDSSLAEEEINRRLAASAELLKADYAPGGELRLLNELDGEDFMQEDFKRLEVKRQMSEAAKLLLPDYLHDKELTIFTALDGEDIYEDDDEGV